MRKSEPEQGRSGSDTPTWRRGQESSETDARSGALQSGSRTRFSPPPPPYSTTSVGKGDEPPRGPLGSSPPGLSATPSVRVPLSTAGQHLGGVRVALVDVDPTRVDALALALRARRAEVHVTTLTPRKSHWRLLRRFCPHALLIDEEVLAGAGADFLRGFRADPFLRHVQLIAVRFERLFRERSGTASIESIKVLLEPLGGPETYLVSRLGPRCEIEFDFDQVPPHLLLRILAGRIEPTRIECTRGRETLVWTIVRGKTGGATLRVGASLEARRLSSEEALGWLLEHKNCQVVLTQPDDFEEYSSASEVIPIVEEKMSGLWDLSQLAGSAPTNVEERGPSTERSGGARLPSDAQMPSPRISRESEPATSEAPVATSAFPSHAPFVRSLGPSSSRGDRLRRSAAPVAWTAALGIPVAVGFVWLSRDGASGSEASSTVAVAAPARVEERPKAEVPASVEGPSTLPAHAVHEAPAVGLPRERVASPFAIVERSAEPCEVHVAERELSEPLRSRMAESYWRAGQRLLVAGKNREAQTELCKSAFLAPAGGGAEQLAELYLTARAPAVAELHVRKVIAEHPEKRSAVELLGDVLHQRGRIDDAKAAWFEAFRIAPSDERTQRAMARHWFSQAQLSLRASDDARAERYLRRTLTLEPQHREARALLHRVLLRMREAELAAAWAPERE